MSMAYRLIRPLRRITTETLASPLSSFSISKTLTAIQPQLQQTRRSYVSEMRKSAFEGNIIRLLRNEIQYELDRSPPSQESTRLGDSYQPE
ncbi:unnamed protein product [Ilex paraguariensis]|uniref:Uncharacterized protein n=1 Tax=Ilex paraguariensis TaxID=185542 RepID=A0ABC8V0E2_9AQUA